MATATIQVRNFTKGDRLRTVAAQLKTADGLPVDLSGNTVAFRMVNTVSGSIKIAGSAATVDDATNGEVSYSWASVDVDTSGEYWAWFIRTSGGLTEHFPAGYLFKVIINPDTVP